MNFICIETLWWAAKDEKSVSADIFYFLMVVFLCIPFNWVTKGEKSVGANILIFFVVVFL